jgi:hypothetical protein
MFALQAANQGGQQQIMNMAAPKSEWDTAREWLAVILPAATSAFGIYSNQLVATNASDNSRQVSMSTNNAFVGMADRIQAPAASNYNYITTTSNTPANSYNQTDNHSSNNTPANSYNPVNNNQPDNHSTNIATP